MGACNILPSLSGHQFGGEVECHACNPPPIKPFF